MVRLVAMALSLIFILPFPADAGAKHSSKILSFKVWKQKKIYEAKALLNELHSEKNGEVGQAKFHQSEVNLSMAKELSANDYFVLYVIPHVKDNPEILLQAAKTLSPIDMVEIMGAYQKHLQSEDILGARTQPAINVGGVGGSGEPPL